uniref:Putative capsid morphogenesis protein n=1 Tax=viral metagenome TaxID=1070528 RepID=A0A6H1Z6N5_9ZZZZ
MNALRDKALAIFREADNAAKRLREVERQREIERATKRFAALFRKQGSEFMARFERLAGYFHEAAADRDLADAFSEIFAVTREEAEDAMARSLLGGLQLGYEAEASKFGIEVAFKMKPERAVAWANANAATKVARVNTTTEDTIRRLVTKGIEEGKSYSEVARQIKGGFDEFAGGQPQEHIRSRAELVAVQENAMAYEAGQSQLVSEIEAVGIRMEKSIDGPDDDLTSGICRDALAMGWVPMDTVFPGGEMTAPLHVACRHSTAYRIAED